MPKIPPMPDYIAAGTKDRLIRDKGAMAKVLFNDDLKELKLYRGTLEAFIQNEESKDVAALEKHAEPGDGEFWSYHYPYQWQDVIGSQLRKSFLVSLLSLAEFHMGLLCRDVAEVVEARIKCDDLRGNSVFARARKYLEAFGNFQSPAQAVWEIIGDLYALRNSIVHNAASVDNDRNSARIQSLEHKAPGISFPSAGVVDLKSEFSVFAIEKVEGFLNDLHQEYVRLCNGLENG